MNFEKKFNQLKPAEKQKNPEQKQDSMFHRIMPEDLEEARKLQEEKDQKQIQELQEKLGISEKKEKLKPTRIVTGMGSVYEYLPDGRTQRFQKATGEMHEPQDTLVFIPPWKLIESQAKTIYPKIFNSSGIDNQVQYNQFLLEYAQLKGHTIRVVDEKGKELRSNQDIEKSGKVFITLIDKNNPQDIFYIPVSKEPKIGYLTFDTRKYKNEKGETDRKKHIGNKVTEIQYSSGQVEREDDENSDTRARADTYFRESVVIAQNISRRWKELRELKKQNPNLLVNYPKLDEIESISKPPKTGIQVLFESRVDWINNQAGNDDNARSRMLYRLKEDLERINQQLDQII